MGGNSSMVKCPCLIQEVGCSIYGHWVNCRSAPLERDSPRLPWWQAKFRLWPAANCRHQK